MNFNSQPDFVNYVYKEQITDEETPIDMTDSSDVLNNILYLSASTQELPQMIADKMFKIGVLLNMGKIQMTHKELSVYTNIPREQLTKAKRIAKDFDNNIDEFRKAFKESNSKSWKTYVYLYFQKTKEVDFTNLLSTITQKVRPLLTHLIMNPANVDVYRSLATLRDVITRVVPLDMRLFDGNFLKYSECACCGEYPPPVDGFFLKQHKNNLYLQYPICAHCEEEGKEPDMTRVAEMYARYSINMENIINRL